MTDERVFNLLSYPVFDIWCVSCAYSTSQLRRATIQGLHSHTCLAATVPNTAAPLNNQFPGNSEDRGLYEHHHPDAVSQVNKL